MAIQAHLFPDNLGFALGNSQGFSVETASPSDNFCFDQFSQPRNLSNLQFHHQPQSMTVSAYMDKQRFEFEQLVNLQNERLRIAMQEQGRKQTADLMKKYEWKTELLVGRKEEEIARAARRNSELHNFLKRIEIENLMWQRAAKENEAAIASLKCSIQRLRESAHEAEDADSCCEESDKLERKLVCKCCNSRNSCVVMLPCRHLCSCRDCQLFLDSCPVCSMPKKTTIEALI